MAAGVDRLTMCQTAAAQDALFAVSDLEIGRQEPTFTIETARRLLLDGWPRVDWLIGGDSVPRLPTWHRWEELLDTVNFVVMQRPGYEIHWDGLPARLKALRDHVVIAPLIDISATDIRRRVAGGQSIRYLTADPVIDYIRARRLYV